MTVRTQTCHAPAQPTGIKSFLSHLIMAHSTWRQRQVLKTLDASRLDDIGLTREDAHKEAQKPIWDVPAHWRG